MIYTMKLKRTLCALLCAALLMGTMPLIAFAGDTPQNGELTIISYNVSGIPIIGGFQGSARLSDKNRAAAIGSCLNGSGADIIGVQEDFNYHANLVQQMTNYGYATVTKGRIPFGDGINVFSKRPIYNVQRFAWDTSYGVLSGSMDRLAEKGVVWSVVEIADNILADVFVVHCDAGRDRKSIAARKDNFRQVAQLVNNREYDRPVFVIGDFNSTYERNTAENFYVNLMQAAGLRDVWTEIHNGGDGTYDDGKDWNPDMREYVDRIMYKSGGGVELTVTDNTYIQYENSEGKTYTDHSSVSAKFSYTVTNPVENTQELVTQTATDSATQLRMEVGAFFKSILLALTSIHELLYLITQISDYI